MFAEYHQSMSTEHSLPLCTTLPMQLLHLHEQCSILMNVCGPVLGQRQIADSLEKRVILKIHNAATNSLFLLFAAKLQKTMTLEIISFFLCS